MLELSRFVANLQAATMKDRSELFDELYQRLRQVARGRLASEYGANANGDATSLVNEAYLKLRGWTKEFRSENHFLAIASAVMRQVLVDRARALRALKRSAELAPLSAHLEERPHGAPCMIDLIVLDETLERLESFDSRAARIVEMRVFLGLKEEEIASDLGISIRTVKRDWLAARAWLKAEMHLDRFRSARPHAAAKQAAI